MWTTSLIDMIVLRVRFVHITQKTRHNILWSIINLPFVVVKCIYVHLFCFKLFILLLVQLFN